MVVVAFVTSPPPPTPDIFFSDGRDVIEEKYAKYKGRKNDRAKDPVSDLDGLSLNFMPAAGTKVTVKIMVATTILIRARVHHASIIRSRASLHYSSYLGV